MSSPTPWRLEVDFVETCNCDFGCPCNFSGFPTGGRCEALVSCHIRKGSYGDIGLEGLNFIYAASWPRAIHQGDGTLRAYIDERANSAQRNAMSEIAHG
jgi:hypothetical protein